LAGAAEFTELVKDKPDHLLQPPIWIEAEIDMPIPGVADRRGDLGSTSWLKSHIDAGSPAST
jgi:hypothetical protein